METADSRNRLHDSNQPDRSTVMESAATAVLLMALVLLLVWKWATSWGRAKD
jgi:hypothetical protein